MADSIPIPTDHRSFGNADVGVAWGLFAPATVFIVARLYVRLGLRKNAGWDDFWIVVAWLVSLYTSICTQLAVINGGGQHIAYILGTLKPFLFYVALIEFGLTWGISFVKISVIAFVLRLVNKNTGLKRIRWICYLDLALIIPTTIGMCVVFALQCMPLSALWDEAMPPSKCWDHRVIGDVVTAYGAISAASDLLTGILPVFVLARMQMEKTRKISVIILTGMGCCISAAAIYKAVVSIGVYTDEDISYGLAKLSISCSVELNLGIMVATLPTLPPLLEAMGLMQNGKFFPLHSSRSSSTAHDNGDDDTANRDSTVPPMAATFETGSGFKRMFSNRVPSRKVSESTLIEEGRGAGGGLDGFVFKHDETRSESVITRTIDVEVEEQSDRESLKESDDAAAAQFPWLHVGRRYASR